MTCELVALPLRLKNTYFTSQNVNTGTWCQQCKTLNCENDGICRIDASVQPPAFYCACPPHFYGNRCENSKCLDYCEHVSTKGL